MEEKQRKWLIYCSYTVNGEEKLVDYTLMAPSRVGAKKRAMNRMIMAHGENRCIDEINELTPEFLAKEKLFTGHEGKAL